MTDTKITALEKAREAMAARRAAGEVIVRLNPIERARAKPKSRPLAIAGKCFDCVGQDSDPGWRERIRECASKTCTLVNHRPYKRSDEEQESDVNAGGDEGAEVEPC